MAEIPPERKRPSVLDLAPGVYSWCACGKSATQPFCDGTHKGSGVRPVKFEIVEVATKALCNCKTTRTPPWCDGSHRTA